MRDGQIPEAVYPLLHDYRQLLTQYLPDLLEACYLHGSIALNAFNERLSDSVVRPIKLHHRLTVLTAFSIHKVMELLTWSHGGF
jgi:hypothetical protein